MSAMSRCVTWFATMCLSHRGSRPWRAIWHAAGLTAHNADRDRLTMYKHKDASQTSGAGVPITWSRFVCFLSVLGLLGIVLG